MLHRSQSLSYFVILTFKVFVTDQIVWNYANDVVK